MGAEVISPRPPSTIVPDQKLKRSKTQSFYTAAFVDYYSLITSEFVSEIQAGPTGPLGGGGGGGGGRSIEAVWFGYVFDTAAIEARLLIMADGLSFRSRNSGA